MVSLEPKTDGTAIGANPFYTFELKRQNSEKGWVIFDLNTRERLAAFENSQKSVHDQVERFGATSLILWNLWLPALIRDRDFKIITIRSADDGGERLRIDFDYQKQPNEYPERGALQITGGWMVLDPKLDWILREFEVYSHHPNKSLIWRKFEAKAGTGGHPLLKSIETRIKVKEEDYESRSDSECDIWEDRNLPIMECSLSAFGLNEPPGVQFPTRSRWYLWFIGGAVVCLCIGAYLFHRLSKRRAAIPPKPVG
jgi:hypothetical protein